MCIKSIVSFDQYALPTEQLPQKSKRVRNMKENKLKALRLALQSGDCTAVPGFWLHIPLPEAHTSHDLLTDPNRVMDGPDASVMDTPGVEEIVRRARECTT